MYSKLLVLAAVIALAASALIVDSTQAARREATGGAATLSFSPNPAVAGSDYVVVGTGFAANKSILIEMKNSSTPWTASYNQVVSDASGSFSYTRPGINNQVPGQVVHNAYYVKRNGRYTTPVTTATLLVVAP